MLLLLKITFLYVLLITSLLLRCRWPKKDRRRLLTVSDRSGCPMQERVSSLVTNSDKWTLRIRLRHQLSSASIFFDNITVTDHACILGPPNDWRRRIGHLRQSWLRTVEADLRPMNLGLATSKLRAQDRTAWRKLVTTATSMTGS